MNVFLIDYKEQIFKFCQVNGREGIGLKVRWFVSIFLD